MQFLLFKRVLTLNQEDIFVGCAYTHKRRLDSWVYFNKDVTIAVVGIIQAFGRRLSIEGVGVMLDPVGVSLLRVQAECLMR